MKLLSWLLTLKVTWKVQAIQELTKRSIRKRHVVEKFQKRRTEQRKGDCGRVTEMMKMNNGCNLWSTTHMVSKAKVSVNINGEIGIASYPMLKLRLFYANTNVE
jgi:hypothetical protein